MKKLLSILIAIMMLVGLCAPMAISVGAEETADTWDGSANIKWYIDGKAAGNGMYELNSAEDLAGLAAIVNARTADNVNVCGVYYDTTTYNVLGFKAGSKFNDIKLPGYKAYTPTAGDNSELLMGDRFPWQNVALNCDVILNEGDAADWATTAPIFNWMPIGGSDDNYTETWDTAG